MKNALAIALIISTTGCFYTIRVTPEPIHIDAHNENMSIHQSWKFCVIEEEAGPPRSFGASVKHALGAPVRGIKALGTNIKENPGKWSIGAALTALAVDYFSDQDFDFNTKEESHNPPVHIPENANRIFQVGNRGTIRVSSESCSQGVFIGGHDAFINCSESLKVDLKNAGQ